MSSEFHSFRSLNEHYKSFNKAVISKKYVISEGGFTVRDLSETYVWGEDHLDLLEKIGVKSGKIFQFSLIPDLNIFMFETLDREEVRKLYNFHLLLKKNPCVVWLMSTTFRLYEILRFANYDHLLELDTMEGFEIESVNCEHQHFFLEFKVRKIPPSLKCLIDNWETVLDHYKAKFFLREEVIHSILFNEPISLYTLRNPQILTMISLFDPLTENYIFSTIKTNIMSKQLEFRFILNPIRRFLNGRNDSLERC